MKYFKALIDIKRNKSNTDYHESAVTDWASTDDSDEHTNGNMINKWTVERMLGWKEEMDG